MRIQCIDGLKGTMTNKRCVFPPETTCLALRTNCRKKGLVGIEVIRYYKYYEKLFRMFLHFFMKMKKSWGW